MPCLGQEDRAFSNKNSAKQWGNRSLLWNPGGVLMTADPSYFSHAFARATGVSPKRYRDRLKGL